MAYELLDRAGLAKVVTEISTKVKASLQDATPINVITSGTGDSGSNKIFFSTADKLLYARPNYQGTNYIVPCAVQGPPTDNNSELSYGLPEYLSGTSSYEKRVDYTVLGTLAGAGPHAAAFGPKACAWNDYSVAFGPSSYAGAGSSDITRFDNLMPAARKKYRSSGSTALGANAQAGGACTAVGNAAYAWLTSGTAIGAAANAGGEYGTSLGNNATSASTGSTALGSRAAASARYATAVGYKAAVSAESYTNCDQGDSTVTTLTPTSEENLSVALGAFSTVKPGQTDVVSVGSEMQDFVRNYFNGVAKQDSSNQAYAYDGVTETTERSTFYRRIVNVKDPLEDHDAATKGYVDAVTTGRHPSKSSSGYYLDSTIEAWLVALDEQRVQLKIQLNQKTKKWNRQSLTNALDTELTALVGTREMSRGHGICFGRECYRDNSTGKITWIRGIDEEDGTQPNWIIVPSLYGTVSYDTSTITDKNHGATTVLTIGTKQHSGDSQFQSMCLIPRYPCKPSDTTGPESGKTFLETSIKTGISEKVLFYLQTMWLLQYANTYGGYWMDSGADFGTGTAGYLKDPTTYGGEYGEYQDCMYLQWAEDYIYKQFPSGTKVNIVNKTTGDTVETEVLFAQGYADDSNILCVYVMDYFTYNEGDNVVFEYATPTINSLTGQTDGWLNDGWEDASAFSGQFRQRDGDNTSEKVVQISADTAFAPYRLGGVELGTGAMFSLGTAVHQRVDATSDDWSSFNIVLTTKCSAETFTFPYANWKTTHDWLTGYYCNTLMLVEGSNGDWLWGGGRMASDYAGSNSTTGTTVCWPMTSSSTASSYTTSVWLAVSNADQMMSTFSSPAPFLFAYQAYSLQKTLWATFVKPAEI